MTEPKETGAVLELGQAATRISAALAAHADAPTDATMDALQAAFSAYVTALGSNTTAMTAGGLGLVYKKLDKLTTVVADHTELVDDRFKAYNVELDEYRQQNAVLLKQNQELLTLLEERLIGPFSQVAPRLEAVESSIQGLHNRLDADERRLDAKRERLDEHQARIVVLEQRAARPIEELRAEVRQWLLHGFVALVLIIILVNIIGGYLLWR